MNTRQTQSQNTTGALASLRPRQRRVFDLSRSGHSVTQIAATLGITPVMVRLRRNEVLKALQVDPALTARAAQTGVPGGALALWAATRKAAR